MENEILLVDDSSDDVELAIRALKKIHLANSIINLVDGQQALDYVFDESNSMPRLILLDLKMPKVDGLEVLAKLKSSERTRRIPVVVMTSSQEDRDIIESYNLGVNAYIVKPVNFEQFSKAVSEVGLFWLALNQPPIYS